MIWDFRSLIRRGGSLWPRDWRESSRQPIRPPLPKPESGNRMSEGDGMKGDDQRRKTDEHWITTPWQPPPGSADAWKKPE
jgi:hypothetical protein